MFDLFNSRIGKSYRIFGPMAPGTKELWQPFMTKMTKYLMELKNNMGTKIIFTQKKTGFFGIISNIYSLEHLFIQHVENGDLCFLSTYKFREGVIFVFILI